MADTSIKAIDRSSVHKITSGQVVVDLQTAIKELVENSLDAGATNIEVRFKQYGLTSIEVIDNGTGIAPEDYESIALKHHTSKLSSFADLTTITTFGFRGEALSSLCALSKGITVATARKQEEPVGVNLEFAKTGKLQKKSKVARQRGTTVTITGLFQPLPVRRKELERNIKREFAKALNLLNAYALVPCTAENKGVRLTVNNQVEGGRKTVQLQTDGTPSLRSAVTSLWGPKALVNVEELDISFEVPPDKVAQQRLMALGEDIELAASNVRVRGLTSKFALGCGRTGTDRQFFFINGRPCNLAKVQKTFNEVYRTFSVNQSPFLVADLILPTASCDINVSPDKRTIFLHSEGQLLDALKLSLETTFAPTRSTFDVGLTQSLMTSQRQSSNKGKEKMPRLGTETREEGNASNPLFIPDDDDAMVIEQIPSTPVPPSLPSTIVSNTTVDMCENSGASSSRVQKKEDKPMAPVVEPLLAPPSPTVTTFGQASLLSSSTLVSNNSPAAPEEEELLVSEKNKRAVRQTTLDDIVVSTAGAKWSQKEIATPADDSSANELPASPQKPTASKPASKRGEKDSGPPSKKPRLSVTNRNKASKQTLRTRLTAFMREGSTIPLGRDESSEEEDDEAEDELQDELEDKMDVDRPKPPAEKRPIEKPRSIDLTALEDSGTSQEQEHGPEFIRIVEGGDISMRFDLKHVSTLYQKQIKLPVDPPPNAPSRDEEDDEALLRIIDKDDFAGMNVIGQFNLGFIIARRKKGVEDDLFIVDQHAADEKYNFEDLHASTKIQSQRLIRPQPLELTAADELLAQENLAILKQNGFEVTVDDDAGAGRKLKLVAQPISKNTVFDMKDLEELIHLMADRPAGQTGQVVRCSKARAMFASRACRKSIMVGKPLNNKQMTNVLRHMGTMDQPWNCPHGRPTMRHLLDLNTITDDPVSIDWTKFGVGPAPELVDLTLSDLCS